MHLKMIVAQVTGQPQSNLGAIVAQVVERVVQ